MAHIEIGGFGDGAGIQDYQIGVSALVDAGEAAGREHRFEGCSVSLSGAASEALHEELSH